MKYSVWYNGSLFDLKIFLRNLKDFTQLWNIFKNTFKNLKRFRGIFKDVHFLENFREFPGILKDFKWFLKTSKYYKGFEMPLFIQRDSESIWIYYGILKISKNLKRFQRISNDYGGGFQDFKYFEGFHGILHNPKTFIRDFKEVHGISKNLEAHRRIANNFEGSQKISKDFWRVQRIPNYLWKFQGISMQVESFLRIWQDFIGFYVDVCAWFQKFIIYLFTTLCCFLIRKDFNYNIIQA